MNSSELKNKFNLPFSNLSDAIEWQDAIGFSVIEDYQNGFVSLYKIGFLDKKLEGSEQKDLWISVSYGKKIDEGVSLGTGGNSLDIPIDLDFHKEFSYSPTKDKFYYQHQEISAKEILLKIQRIHKLPTLALKGFRLRFRLRLWRKFIPFLIKSIDSVFIAILWLVSGEKIRNDIMGRRLFEKPNEKIKTVEFDDPKTMDFFGYKAKRWSVVFYCVLHLVCYFLFWKHFA
ncbi:hypothetical protein EBS02_12155, partial [bacterium]|nr:hypothetical protein [bacterium]